MRFYNVQEIDENKIEVEITGSELTMVDLKFDVNSLPKVSFRINLLGLLRNLTKEVLENIKKIITVVEKIDDSDG
jgi:hypothetical protein